AREFPRVGVHRAATQVLGGGGRRGIRQASADRRRHRRFRLCPPAAHVGEGKNRLSAARARALGQTRTQLGRGAAPDDLATITAPVPQQGKRDVFIYMISGAKVRAPAAAMALIERLKGE